MTALLRMLAIGGVGLLTWAAAASHVADQTRLPLAAVLPGAVIAQRFGCTTLELEPFDASCPGRHVHTGIDLAAPAGRTIYAATAGLARAGYDQNGCGLFVTVAFDDHVRILYCHLGKVDVATGTSIKAGMLIGEVGSSGLSTGPHLHFEVQVDGRSVDPALWLAMPSPA